MNKRELKFRVWNIEDKQWDNPSILEVWNTDGVLEPFQYIKSGKLNPLYTPIENYIILQYTGLTDKNGKEIWEGDIVGGLDLVAEIIWEPENSAFQLKSKLGGAFMSWIYLQNFEIIGNIFENPELLKK